MLTDIRKSSILSLSDIRLWNIREKDRGTAMPVKKVEYIDAKEAAQILSRNSGHTVSTDYVRLLSNQKKLTSRPKDGRTKEYLRSDVEAYRVVGKGKNKKPKLEATREESVAQ
jgi:hypothetical protein